MKRNTKRLLLYAYFILLCCVFFSSAFSRHLSRIDGSGEATIAGIKLNVISGTTSLSNVSNQYQDIVFTVNNFDGLKDNNPQLNETVYDYTIYITTTNPDVPLQYELYKVENDSNSSHVTIGNDGGTNNSFRMPMSEAQEDVFFLRVQMDDKNHKGSTSTIKLEVYAVQSESTV